MARRRWSFRMEAVDHRRLRVLEDLYRGWLTPPGRALLWGTVASITFLMGGLSSTLAYIAAFFVSGAVAAVLSGLGPRPSVVASRRLPPPASCGEVWSYEVTITNTSSRPLHNLLVEERNLSAALRPVVEAPVVPLLEPGASASVRLQLFCRLRGIHQLEKLQISRTEPSGLIKRGTVLSIVDRVIIYPRFDAIEHLDVPVGKTHQPGGIPMSKQGDSAELHGLRPWREGDRLRDVHWPSYARMGHLVVREFQEEYFARVALVVDVAAARMEEETRVEQAISRGAAITDALARQDFLIDIFAAGEQVHRIQAGPAVDAMEHVLELLAGLEPGSSLDPAALEALLLPELSRLSAVYFVMASWDVPRRALVQTVRELGATVRVHCVIPGLDLGLGEDEQVS